MKHIGATCWVIPDGYMPAWSTGKKPEMESHESIAVLNVSDQDANLELMLYFSDRDPVGPYTLTIPAKRTRHVRYNSLTDPVPVPVDTDYSSVITSDIPVIVQYTRLDSRQAENALMSVMAFPVENVD